MTTRRLVGTGPRAGLVLVCCAAAPYLAACDSSPPPPDGAIDYATICATAEAEPRRLPDAACRELGATGRPAGGGQWLAAALPPSPVGEVPVVRTDEDGVPYDDVDYVPDTDAGGIFIASVGSPIRTVQGPAWGPPPAAALERTVRGVGPAGGTFTRSGAGTAGFGAPGAAPVVRSAPVVRAPSPYISRGGLGVSGSGGSSGS